MGDAVLVILERVGQQGEVEEMRAVLGYSPLANADSDDGA